MPSEHRIVQIAAGHAAKVRLSRAPSQRPGYVMVQTSHRAPFAIPETRWKDAVIA